MVKYPTELVLNILQFIQNMKIGKVPTRLTEQLGYVRDNSTTTTMATTTSMQRLIFFKLLRLFNALPEFVKGRNKFYFI